MSLSQGVMSCPVCFEEDGTAVTMPCLHFVCLECFFNLLRTSPDRESVTCPLCRLHVDVPVRVVKKPAPAPAPATPEPCPYSLVERFAAAAALVAVVSQGVPAARELTCRVFTMCWV